MFNKILIYDILFVATDLHEVVSQPVTTGTIKIFTLTL